MSQKLKRSLHFLSKKLLILLLACSVNPLFAAIDEVDPSLSPPAPEFLYAVKSGERNGLSDAALAANAGIIGALVVLALVNSHAHSHSH